MTGSEVLRLLEVMHTLRSPGGCPWDAEQTHASLVQYLIEETYETVDAIDANDRDALIEELGDVLLQVVFQSRIGEEAEQPWSIDDVARGIADKLQKGIGHLFKKYLVQSEMGVGQLVAAEFARQGHGIERHAPPRDRVGGDCLSGVRFP